MWMQDLFGERLFDEWMDFPFGSWNRDLRGGDRMLCGSGARLEMKTDVREHADSFTIDMDLPGFKKDQIALDLQNGCLTVSASRNSDRDERDSEGKMIRRERFAGEMRRTFYVGDAMTGEDVKAKFEDGVLHLELPKKEERSLPEKKPILIEG